MSARTFSRLNFTPSSYDVGDTGGSNGHMVCANDHGGRAQGYNVLGNGSEPIQSPPNMQARGFRQEQVMFSHDHVGDSMVDQLPGRGYRTRYYGV